MDCPTATAPINIVKSLNSGDCDLKCDFQPGYQPTSVYAENREVFIRLTFDSDNNPPVVFNKEKYNVSEARLYQPSLHRYGGTQLPAELIISHQNTSQNKELLVCVPIIDSSSSAGIVDSLINQVAIRANSLGGKTSIGVNNFTLSDLVPMKPYYSYTGTLPYFPCMKDGVDYIVYGQQYAIEIQSSSLKKLKKVIMANSYHPHKNPDGFFYNKNGPTLGDIDGDIYIECNPTGADGKVIVPEGGSTGVNPSENIMENILNFLKSPYSSALFGIIVLFIIIKLFNIVAKFVFGSSETSAPPSG
jgi:carbonic anhydrase